MHSRLQTVKLQTVGWGCLAVVALAFASTGLGGDEPAANPGAGDAGAAGAKAAADGSSAAAEKKKLEPDPPGMKRLLPDVNAWIDPKDKRVVIDGTVCLNRGTLEMFACLAGTKEHESVVAVDVPAYAIHAALTAVGAKAGSTVTFQPEYIPATGTPIDITVVWQDDKKQKHVEKAQDWVRDLRTQKPLEYDWVFAGSRFFTAEGGRQAYEAEGGDLICVSNFPSAMLDLPIKSSQATSDLLFEAFTDHIPPIGTKVRLVLTPRLAKADGKTAKSDSGEKKK